jgi:DNA-directed RNA polymerase subunit RPC12/RpoP
MDAVGHDCDADPHPIASLAEPRVACPRCGAHVIVEARLADLLKLICPVCGLRIPAAADHE